MAWICRGHPPTGFNRPDQSSAGLPFSVTPSLVNALPVVREYSPVSHHLRLTASA